MIDLTNDDFEEENFPEEVFSATPFKYQGNVDLSSKPLIQVDTSLAPIHSEFYFDEDEKKVAIIPSITEEGKLLNRWEAIDLYKSTGRHLGMFASEKQAKDYYAELQNSLGISNIISSGKNIGDKAWDLEAVGDNVTHFTFTPKGIKDGLVYKLGETLGEYYFNVEKNWKKRPINWKMIGLGAGAQTLDIMGNATGKAMQMFGDMMIDEKGDSWEKYINPAYPIRQGIGKALKKFGEIQEKNGIQAQKSLYELAGVSQEEKEAYDVEVMGGEFSENPSLERMIYSASQMIPSLGIGRAVYLTTGSEVASLLVMTNADVIDTYSESLEAENSKYKAFAHYLLAGVGTYAGEKFGFEKVFGKEGDKLVKDSVRSLGRKVVSATLSNGSTEGAQTVWQNMVAHYGYDTTRDIFEGLADSVIGGSIGGGIASSFAKSRYRETVDLIRKKEGISKTQAEKRLDLLLEMFKGKEEQINQIVTGGATSYLDGLDNYYNSLTTEQQQQFNQEASRVYEENIGKIKETFPTWTDEQVVSVANIPTVQALGLAQILNVSPVEAAKQVATLERAEEQEFLKQVGESQGLADFQTMVEENAKLDEQYPAFEGDEIDINGVQKTVYNSSGTRIAKSEQALKNFYNWFGNSTAADEKGRPLIFKRGLKNKYSPDIERNIIWTTLSDEVAQQYKTTEEDGEILDVYVKSLKPLIVERSRVDSYYDDILKEVDSEVSFAEGKSAEEKRDMHKKLQKAIQEYGHKDAYVYEVWDNVPEFKEGLEFLGFDSIMGKEGTHITLGVFKPNQIKSTENKGTFSLENDNIYFQDEEAPKGAYINGKVYAFENADGYTIQHEYAHAFKDRISQIDNPAAKAMLDAVDVWENKEFDRKYKILGTEGNYFVAEQDGGKKVYTNMGRNFKTKEEAINYAKNEIFAEGAEKYLSTQEAPSNVLKRAFRSFINFFKESYLRTRALNIELTPEVKQVYATMLGGANIDTFLHAPIDTFLAERQQAQRQKQAMMTADVEKISENNPDAPEDGVDVEDYLKQEKAEIKDRYDANWFVKSVESLSHRAGKVSPWLEAKLQRFFYEKNNQANKRLEKVEKFFEDAHNIKKKSKRDYELLKYGMLNNDFETLKQLSDKYNWASDFASVQEVLDEIYDTLKDLGFNLEYKSDYLPRSVKNYDKFMKHMKGYVPSKLMKQMYEEEQQRGRPFTQEERAQYLNNYLRRQANEDVMAGTNHKKGRTIDYITPDMMQFYEHPVDTLHNYIIRMSERIATANLLGTNEHIAGSIGDFVLNLVDEGKLSYDKVDEAAAVIRASLENTPIRGKVFRGARDIGYLLTMSRVSSAITQLDDFNAAWHNAGFRLAFKHAFLKAGKAREINTVDAAVNLVADEFRTIEGMAKSVDNIFKTTGLSSLDNLMKNTFINSDLERMRNMSDVNLKEELKYLFDNEGQLNQVVHDIKNGINTTDTLFVAWTHLAKYQPISRFEMPEYYNGEARLWYMLKSFTLKRIDQHWRHLDDVLNTSKSAKERAKAAADEARLLALMLLCGASKDVILDLIYGRKIELDDIIINNMWGWVGLNKYFIYKAKEQGLGSMAMSLVVGVPAVDLINTLQRDLTLYFSYDKNGNRKRELKDLDMWKYTPLVGDFYYWYYGGGAKRELKKEMKERKEKIKAAAKVYRQIRKQKRAAEIEENKELRAKIKQEKQELKRQKQEEVQARKREREEAKRVKDALEEETRQLREARLAEKANQPKRKRGRPRKKQVEE